MKTFFTFTTLLLMSTVIFAQNHGGVASASGPRVSGVGLAASPAAQAAPRNAVLGLFPTGVPSAVTSLGFNQRLGVGRQATRGTIRPGSFVYAYPVYVGGGYYGDSYTGQAAPPVSTGQEQPNVVVVYPPQQPPVIINQFGSGDPQYATRVQPQNLYPMPAAQAPEQPAETSHYLIAFKDHSIYSAVAYWVDGDTLHYFTTGSTHNQASVSLVDRELTDRLNKESGAEVKLPPAK